MSKRERERETTLTEADSSMVTDTRHHTSTSHFLSKFESMLKEFFFKDMGQFTAPTSASEV